MIRTILENDTGDTVFVVLLEEDRWSLYLRWSRVNLDPSWIRPYLLNVADILSEMFFFDLG